MIGSRRIRVLLLVIGILFPGVVGIQSASGAESTAAGAANFSLTAETRFEPSLNWENPTAVASRRVVFDQTFLLGTWSVVDSRGDFTCDLSLVDPGILAADEHGSVLVSTGSFAEKLGITSSCANGSVVELDLLGGSYVRTATAWKIDLEIALRVLPWAGDGTWSPKVTAPVSCTGGPPEGPTAFHCVGGGVS